MKIIGKNKEELLYISQGNTIRGIDMNSHKFVFEWNIGKKVVTFDAVTVRNGSILIIAAVEIDN